MVVSRLIGGMFGLPRVVGALRPSLPEFLSGPSAFTANARSALGIVCRQIVPRFIWLPSYLCEVILRAVEWAKCPYQFYPTNGTLGVDDFEWIKSVSEEDAVLLIDYFGFPQTDEVVNRCRETGAVVIEDACQALLSDCVGTHADYTVYSPRKWVGVPDGGILKVAEHSQIPEMTLTPPDEEWWLTGLEASIQRRQSDDYCGEDREWFSLFQKHDREDVTGPFSMSDLSKSLLRRCFDYEEIAARRRDNYSILYESLSEYSLTGVLPTGVVPLGFPIRTSRRDDLRQAMFAEQIYPPVHWDLDGVVPESFTASHQLSREIMTLPCDQRYGEADMQRLVSVIRSWEKT